MIILIFFSEYFIVVIALSTLLLCITIIFIIQMLCCKKDTKTDGIYSEISQVEPNDEIKTEVVHDEEKKAPSSLDVEREIICEPNESRTPLRETGDDAEVNSIPSTEDTISVNSNDSNGNYKDGFLFLNTIFTVNPNVQTSIIYEKEKNYVAGKIIQVTDLMFDEKYSPMHLRVHVVVFPVKKCAIKTNWYEIRNDGKIKLDEYFKFVFNQTPSDKRGRLRIRVYVQSTAVGMYGKPECIGETYVNLIEITTAGGGKTVWRPLSRDVHPPQAMLEEP